MLRGGRFDESMDSDAAKYTASIDDDYPLVDSVVRINIAHVHMLKERGIIDESSADEIIDALKDLLDQGFDSLEMRPELEDIHMVLEEYLSEEVGEEVGGKMHTAKSRNDQVATAIRMVLREEILNVQDLIVDLIENLCELASENKDTIMPGYTHLQVAEPTTFAHYLNAYGQVFVRNLDRLDCSYEQTDKCPLGSCAFAGTSFPIDREMTKDLLGFEEVMGNTMDAVGSRDFCLDAMSSLSVTMNTLSRFSEEIVLWSSAEFDMIEIPDEFSSTSSIMPQKKNPVVAEIERAKASRTMGNMMGGLTLMKALSQAYSLDLQELTPLLWDSISQTKSSLRVMNNLVKGMQPNEEAMEESVDKGLSTMTELANTIVRESGIPFRKAHNIVGKLASNASENDKNLSDLSFEDLQSASEEVTGKEVEIDEDDFRKALDPSSCVKRKNLLGGPAPESVEREISGLIKKAESYREVIDERRESISKAEKELLTIAGGV